MKPHIVGVGASVLDTVIAMDRFPEEDSKAKARSVLLTGGGPVGNALVCLSKLGVSCEYLGFLSNDNSGKFLAKEYEKWGVSTSHVVFAEGNPFTSFIFLSEEKGTRTCLFDRGTLPEDPALLDFSCLDKAIILHLDGNHLPIAIPAAKYAKQKGVLVSLDAGSLYPGIEELLPLVDLFIASEAFARDLTGEKDIENAVREIAKRYNPKVLVVTEGKKGGTYVDEEGKILHYSSFSVPCKDSNGAGDTFHGAFLAAYLEKKTIGECCCFASAASAIKCTKVGVRNALPTKEEVLEFLAKGE